MSLTLNGGLYLWLCLTYPSVLCFLRWSDSSAAKPCTSASLLSVPLQGETQRWDQRAIFVFLNRCALQINSPFNCSEILSPSAPAVCAVGDLQFAHLTYWAAFWRKSRHSGPLSPAQRGESGGSSGRGPFFLSGALPAGRLVRSCIVSYKWNGCSLYKVFIPPGRFNALLHHWTKS